MPDTERIRATILELVEACGPKKTISPSHVAKAIEPDEDKWRRLLKTVRHEAFNLAREDQIVIRRKGKIQNPFEEIKGVIRLGPPEN
jgi:hypothetical protein